MPDDRPADTATDQLATLQSDFDDFRSTMLARAARRPTGTIEYSLLPAAKADTLILNGAVVSRATYANLWQWAQDNALVIAGLFTVGDGSTTFGLPDLRGRVPIGVGTLGSATYALGNTGGASSVTLTTANMPAHTHTTDTQGGHDHPGSGALADGSHGGHNSGSFGIAAGGDGAVASNGDTANGYHNHSLSLSFDGGHSHTTNASGSGTAFDNRSPYLAINALIWT